MKASVVALIYSPLTIFLAERVGFEPTVRLSPYTRFPGVRLKPLIHLSEARILTLWLTRPSEGRNFSERVGLWVDLALQAHALLPERALCCKRLDDRVKA